MSEPRAGQQFTGGGSIEDKDETARWEADKAITAGEPYAEIRQVGRWQYYVTVHHGIIQWGPDGCGWHAWGRKRAERKAASKLRAYERYRRHLDAPRTTVRLP